MKKFLGMFLQVGYFLFAIFVIAIVRVLNRQGDGEIFLVLTIWLVVGYGSYWITNKLFQGKEINKTLVKVICWANLFSWLIGFVGLLTFSVTLSLSKLLPERERRYFRTLAFINLTLSLSNLIISFVGVITDVWLGVAALIIIPVYLLFALIFYLLYIKKGHTQTRLDITKSHIGSRIKEKEGYHAGLSKIMWIFLGGISILILSSLFYWFQIRPSQIRHDCSWVKYTTGAIPAKPAMSEEELITKGIIKSCGVGEFKPGESTTFGFLQTLCPDHNKRIIEEYKTSRPAVPEKESWGQAEEEEYKFCIHDKGL